MRWAWPPDLRLVLLAAGVVVLSGIALLVYVAPRSSPLTLHVLPRREAAIGDPDDPAGRDRFEWLRLHDPSTGTIPAGIRGKELAFSSRLPLARTRRAEGLLKATGPTGFTTWTARGPYNVGGRTRALAPDAADPTVLLAGAVSGGMWRSTDAGNSWTKVTRPSQLHSVTCIAQNLRSGRSNVWYYGTGELLGNSGSGGAAAYRGDGIFKSADGGRTWAPLPSTVSGTPQAFDQMFDYVWNIALDPTAADDRIYAATIGGIARSTDGGASWSTVLGGFTDTSPRYTDVAVGADGVAYATLSTATIAGQGTAADAGVYRSPDGLRWTRITPAEGWPGAWERLVIAIAPQDPRVVFVAGHTPGFGHAGKNNGETEWNSLWRYRYLSGTGAGADGLWEDRSANLPSFGGLVGDFVTQGGYDLVMKVRPDNDSTLILGGTNLYVSLDGFRTANRTTWIGGYATSNTVEQYANHHPDQHALAFDPEHPLALYSAHDGGISFTDNYLSGSVSWRSLDRGYVTSQFYSIALDLATPGNPVIIGGTQDNGTWLTSATDAGAPWTQLLGGDGGVCAVAGGRSSYYASFQNGEIYRLLYDERTGRFTGFTRVDPTGGSDYLFIAPFRLDPANANIMYLGAGAQLWRNSNLTGIPLNSQETTTSGWTLLASATMRSGTITALGVSSANPPSRLYYGGSSGQVFRLDGASAAVAGSVPVDVSTGKGLPPGAYVSCIAVDPRDGDRALLVFSNYGVPSLFATVDAGKSWTGVAGNLEQNPDGSGSGPSVRWASVLPLGSGTMYFVGTSTGVYSTTALVGAATVWATEADSAIGNAVVDMLDARAEDRLVVAATHGLGVFTANVTYVSPPVAAAATTALMQNFPNPFSRSTAIRFSLAQAADVTIRIYDLTGQEVARPLSELMPAGADQTILWTPVGLASGIYFCRFTAGGLTQTCKMVYVK